MTIRSTEMSNTHSPSLISIVFSFRNEAENIPVLIARIGKVFTAEDVDYELIFVNDASSDDSLSVLMQEHRRNPKVKVINMSRRFGVSECTRAGMEAARGAAVIYMDADLQDPPELIPKLLAHWRSGAQIVHTIRTRRLGESRFKMWLTKQAYRVIRLGSTVNIPVDAGDFKLLSRVAVDQLLRLRESDPYLRGLVAWIGFPYAVVPYDRVARHAGRTHFPFFSRNPWKTVVTGLTSFSFLPIYICGAFGALGLMISALMAALALVLKFRGDHGAGILAVLCLFTFFWASTIAAISVVALYVIRIYKDVRDRPEYIVESSVGLPEVSGTAVGSRADEAVAPKGDLHPRTGHEEHPEP